MPDFDKLTVVEKSRLRRWKKKVRLRRMGLGLGVGAVVASLFVALSAFGQPLLGSVQPHSMTSDENSSEVSGNTAEEITNVASTEELPEEPINVLVMGVDRRPDGSSEELGVRSDAIMVARVYPDTGEVRMLSLPRDLYVEVAPGQEDRINVAYAEGGVDQTKAVVERFTGLNIDNYALVDFAGFEEVVDALDGVKVKVRENEYPPGSRLEAGKQKLDGEQALEYARYRYSGGGDLDRIKHQQQIIRALRGKVLRLSTISKLPELVRVAQNNVETNVGVGDAVSLVRTLVKKDERGDIEAYQLEGEPTVLDDGREVLTPKTDENQRIISQFVQ